MLLQISKLESDKVDKIDGKQLSTNDYDNVSKAFLDSLKSKRLVELGDLKTDLKQFNEDSEHRLVSDVEKLIWNSKANAIHLHEIKDVNGLLDELNSKSDSAHSHTTEEIGAEKIGIAAGLIDSHNKSSTAHEDIKKTLSELTNKIDGINSAISFENEQELSNWLSGSFTRSDGLTPNNLFVGQHIYVKDQDENDYWVSTKPVNSISDLTPLPTDKINLEDYAEISDLKRVAFTGSHKDLIDVPNIPNALSELTEDENHKTITQEKLNLIDTNASNILGKLDKNLGKDQADKILVTDANGNISTAVAGSMALLIDNLESNSTTMAPTANQVRILNNLKLDKQQGSENSGKHLIVNDFGLIDLIEPEQCLPLTAGKDKPITGDLYVKDGTTTKNIYIGANARLRDNGSNGFIISTNGSVYLRAGGDEGSATGLILTTDMFKPQSNEGNSLGTSTGRWKEIHGTTIYQNGKQVANAEDIPNTSDLVTLSGTQTISSGKTFSAGISTDLIQSTNSENIISNISNNTYVGDTTSYLWLQSSYRPVVNENGNYYELAYYSDISSFVEKDSMYYYYKTKYEESLNLFNEDTHYHSGQAYGDGGNIVWWSGYTRFDDYIKVKPYTAYTLSINAETNIFITMCYYNADLEFISDNNSHFGTFVTPENCEYIRFACGKLPSEIYYIMLNEGAVRLPYTKYNANKHITNEQATLLKDEYEKTLNLFKFAGESITIHSGNEQWKEYRFSDFGLVEGETYTISSYDVPNGISLQLLDGYNNFANSKITFVYNSSNNRFRVGGNSVSQNTTFDLNVQIIKGIYTGGYHDFHGSILHYRDLGTLLWENGSPNSDFGEQQVTTLDRSGFRYIVVVYKNYKSDERAWQCQFFKNSTYYQNGSLFFVEVGYTKVRSFSFESSSTRVLFGNGYENGNQSNSQMIPVAIYGIK